MKWYDITIEGIKPIYQINENFEIRNKKRNKPVKIRYAEFSGYYTVGLRLKDKKAQKSYFLHRIIVDTFIQKLKEGDIVNHIDGDKTNNELYNLEITDYSGNTIHAYKHKLRHSGEKHYNSKYSDELTESIAKCICAGLSTYDIRMKHPLDDISKYFISDLKRGKCRKDIGRKYGFVK